MLLSPGDPKVEHRGCKADDRFSRPCGGVEARNLRWQREVNRSTQADIPGNLLNWLIQGMDYGQTQRRVDAIDGGSVQMAVESVGDVGTGQLCCVSFYRDS